MSKKEKNARGITTLPDNLYEAIIEVETSELVKEALGEHIFNKFIENKKIEWDMYRTHVSKYEIEKYLPIT
jgi:glutamine synthetase